MMCSVSGCSRPQKNRGWCHAHYKRWQTNGDVAAEVPVRGPRGQCSVDGCDRPHAGKGFCAAHYSRWLRDGGPGGPEVGARHEHCTVCGGPHLARGFCATHYSRWHKNGDPGPVEIRREATSYTGAHARIVRLYGRAADHACVDCGDCAEEWSYDHECSNERHDDVRGPYSMNPERYDPRCKSCHRRFDDHPFFSKS